MVIFLTVSFILNGAFVISGASEIEPGGDFTQSRVGHVVFSKCLRIMDSSKLGTRRAMTMCCKKEKDGNRMDIGHPS